MEDTDFSQHVSMFEGAVKGGVMSDEDILELFQMTYRAYPGSSCFRQFWNCSSLFRERKPELFKRFASELMKKSASPELKALSKDISEARNLTVDSAITVAEKLKNRKIPSCLVIVVLQHTMVLRGEKLRERLEDVGIQAIQTSHLLTTETPIHG